MESVKLEKKTEKDIYSVSEASQISGMTAPRIMRRIRNETIAAEKVGWVWVIPKAEVEKLKQEMEDEKKEDSSN